ncbi:MAG: SDR family oxidoreductase [Parvularculaceae bacterium]|nr:SDR family oxidoreductase [Parvularculaceae bacterium]
MNKPLAGKVAIVTGAAGGIGAATAAMFVRKGAKVVLADIDEAGLARAASAISDRDAIRSIRCDVTSVSDMEAAVKLATGAFGGMDAAILNAGIEGDVTPLEDLTVAAFEKVMSVSVTGGFVGLKTCFPALKARGGGTLLMTSSTSGKIGAGGLAPYTAAKHGLIGLMRAAALEGAPFNIRVNTVNPCPVETRMMRALEKGFSPDDSEAMRRALVEAIPLKRYAEPDDVAEMFAFLSSDAARFATGGVYMIDGGMLAGLVRA